MKRLTDAEVWVRVSCSLLNSDLSVQEIGKEADAVLKEYRKRFGSDEDERKRAAKEKPEPSLS
jgi:hypothetical protein